MEEGWGEADGREREEGEEGEEEEGVVSGIRAREGEEGGGGMDGVVEEDCEGRGARRRS